jgi:hypothetical protein
MKINKKIQGQTFDCKRTTLECKEHTSHLGCQDEEDETNEETDLLVKKCQ